MKVILSNEAREDLNNIFHYISHYSLKHAIENDENIILMIHKLKYTPYLGRYVQVDNSKKLREIIYKKYRIVYEVIEKSNIIYIHFIIHYRRNFKSFYKSYLKTLNQTN